MPLLPTRRIRNLQHHRRRQVLSEVRVTRRLAIKILHMTMRARESSPAADKAQSGTPKKVPLDSERILRFRLEVSSFSSDVADLIDMHDVVMEGGSTKIQVAFSIDGNFSHIPDHRRP